MYCKARFLYLFRRECGYSKKRKPKDFFNNSKHKNVSVPCKAYFVDVSDNETLVHIYWTAFDSLGNKKDFKGLFHAFWKNKKTEIGNMFGIKA